MSDADPSTHKNHLENPSSNEMQSIDSAERSSDVLSEDKEQGDNEESSEQTGEKEKCSQCSESDYEAEATLICKNEKISLCNNCGRRHKLDESTKHHEIARLQDDRMICDLCLDSSIPGYGFCTDCKQTNPEVLCLPCSKRHCAKEKFANHTICTNLDLMKQGESSEDDSSKICLDEDTDVDNCNILQKSIFPMETCLNCHDEGQFIEYVCTLCKSRLCMDCFSSHNSDEHITIPVQEFIGNKYQCLTCNAHASHHCQSCNLDFCHECRIFHQENNLMEHKWIDIISHAFLLRDVSAPACYKCVPEKSIPAIAFCLSCAFAIPMCESCSHAHIQQFGSHTLCYDIASFDEECYEEQQEDNQSVLMPKIKCTPCTFVGDDNEATTFCLTCTEPEPMCRECATQHIRERKTRGHELCHDLEKLKPSVSNDMLCENCKVNGETRIAMTFCLTCEQPEPYCEDCARIHVKQKEFRSHDISFNIQHLTKYIPCEPCFFESIESPATHVCMSCEEPEPMCKSCANQHLKQRSGRGHSLCDDISKFPGFENVTFRFSKSMLASKETGNIQKTPGKPKALKILSDSVELFWSKSAEKVDYYQIRYKSKSDQEKWKFVQTATDQNQIQITGLMADTRYIFQVQGVFQDREGSYGPANDNVKTSVSLASVLLKHSIKVSEGSPSKYQLVSQEQKSSRDRIAKTRKLLLGNSKQGTDEEKTILLVGATGSGKSTLVDGIVNYMMGVTFDDQFRFTLVQLEEEERKTHNQAVSQTEWVTVYRIAPQNGSRLNYILNIIDTPGFGDTRGIERDQGIVDQIRHLFSSEGEKGVLFIDAVCFVVKAPDARLTISQKHIFSSIMSLFGKDIESNICTLITFADGAEPPVLASLKEANLPFGLTFQFNNSALFAENKNLTPSTLSPMFWEMGINSLQMFFNHLDELETRSLSQTKTVLMEREQLKTIIASILPQVKAGLSKLAELRDQLELFKKHKDDIENNKDFEYVVEETKQRLVDLPHGRHVTNCLQCNVTCHENCSIADDEKKRKCRSMKDGFCKVCIGKCIWSEHKNTPYIIKYSTVKVKKTYAEMKQKYEQAKGSTLTHQTYIEELTYDVDYLFENIKLMMNEMTQCKRRLKETALRPDPLSAVEHIDLMIHAEVTEKQHGYRRRIRMLREFKRMALVDEQISDFDQTLKLTKDDITSAVGKTFQGDGRAPNKRKANIIQRGANYLKNFFF